MMYDDSGIREVIKDILSFMRLDGKWQVMAKVSYGQPWDDKFLEV